MADPEFAVAELWAQFARGRANAARDRLIEHYLRQGLIPKVARNIIRRIPREVQLEELTGAGAFGLLSAVERFDPHRCVKFETFAQPLIRGAILDYLRELDVVSRQTRTHLDKLYRAREQLSQKLGRPASDSEVRDRLELSSTQWREVLNADRALHAVRLGEQKHDRPSGLSVQIADPRLAPEREAVKRDLQTLITRGLSREERLTIILLYYEGLTMREAGVALDLSEARICQIHKSVLARLKSRFAGNRARLEEEAA